MSRLAKVMGAGLLLLAWLASAASVHAQDYPIRPIRFVVPYSAGGLPDVMARMIGQHLSDTLKQPVIIDNMPGSGGIAASETVSKAPPDGYTLLVTDGSQLTVNPHLYARLPYDPVKSLTPVSLIGVAPLFLAVNLTVSAQTLPEFISLAKAKPGSLNYGSSGTGSIPHLAVEALKAAAGIDILHIPYKGSQQAVQALLAGDVAFSMVALSSVISQWKAGKIRLLAVSAARRSSQAPGVPTFEESGFPDFVFEPQIGVVAPAGTPSKVVERLSTAIGEATRQPDTVAKLEAVSIEPIGSSPQDYARLIREDYARYGRVVRASGARVD